MADTPSQPPGWPYDQNPQPTPGPRFEPPIAQPAPPPTIPATPPSPPPQPPPPAPYEPPYPQAPPPPAGGWTPPAPTPKKSNIKKILLIVGAVIGVLALGIGACSVWFISTVKAPVDESNRFLAAVDQGDYGAAVAMSDPACNQGMTAADIDALFQGRDITYDLKSSQITNSSATVSGSFTIDGADLNYVELSLRNDDGWRVCGLFLDERSS